MMPSRQLSESLFLLKRMGVIDQQSTRLSLSRLLQKYVLATKFASCEPSLIKALCTCYEKEILSEIYEKSIPEDSMNDLSMAQKDEIVLKRKGVRRSQRIIENAVKQA